MLTKKGYIFAILLLKREIPLFSYLIVTIFYSVISFSFLYPKSKLINYNRDISYLLKVVETPNRNKSGEAKFKAKILGEVKSKENAIVVREEIWDLYLYCKAIELPWKNISNLNVSAILIARGELLELRDGTNLSNFIDSNEYNGVFKIKFVSIIRNSNSYDYFKRKIDHIFSSSEVKALYKAILFGDKSGLSLKLEKMFRNLGLSHLLVVSGFHIGVFFFISSSVLIKFLRYFSFIKYHLSLNLLADIFSFLVTLAYCMLVGFKPSCVRALLSIICFIIYKNLGYRSSFLHLISIYFLCFLTFNNNLLLSLGVQYSFLALIGIMYASFLKIKNKALNYILVSVFACTFTSILTLSTFDSYNLLSILTNIAFSPLFILLICKAGFFFLLVSILSLDLAKLFGSFIEMIVLQLFNILDFLSSIKSFEIKSMEVSSDIYVLSFILFFIYINYFLIKKYRLKYNI